MDHHKNFIRAALYRELLVFQFLQHSIDYNGVSIDLHRRSRARVEPSSSTTHCRQIVEQCFMKSLSHLLGTSCYLFKILSNSVEYNSVHSLSSRRRQTADSKHNHFFQYKKRGTAEITFTSTTHHCRGNKRRSTPLVSKSSATCHHHSKESDVADWCC